MPIFYFIHNLDWGNNLKDGVRNSRTFIIGVCVYILFFVVIQNLQISFGGNERFDTLKYGLLLLLIADVCVMSYLYKRQYNRLITEELGKEDETRYKYDENNRKYVSVPIEEKLDKELHEFEVIVKHEEQQKEIISNIEKQKQQRMIDKETKNKRDLIIKNKNYIRAILRIQRFWRRMLYSPPNGIFYKKSLQDFNKYKNQIQK